MTRYTFSDEVRSALESQQQPLAIYQYIDHKVVTLLVSDGFCELLGYTDRAQAVWDMDHDMYKDTHPDDIPRIVDAALRFAKGETPEYESVFRTRAGADSDYHVIHARGKHVYLENGVRLAHIWYMDEGSYVEGDESATNGMSHVINSVLHEESILRRFNYDKLTGLPNLAYFFKLCEIGKERVFGEGKQGCILYMDLNGMKYFNFRNGFTEGDRMLKDFAALLSRIFGPENSCHIGADRFLVSTTEDGVEDRLRECFDAFSRMERHLPVKVGIYSTSIEDVPVSTAYDRSKVACDSIPASETSEFRYYTLDLSEADRIRRHIQTSIDKAVSEKWIQVYYQPIVRAINGKVCDEEALARWIDPERGFLSPAAFIPYLEESGQIFKLDLYVLEQVLEKMKRQKAAGLNVVPHSFNLSRSDFTACDIVEEIRKRVDDAGIPRDMITVEITESTVGETLEFMKIQIARFQELGFKVWLDDFGSGYSSLEVLQSMQFDLIKFDMSFMRRLNDSENARIVLTELMRMAASLKVSTVCEGVETKEQVQFLQEIGCSKLQGFYFCKPIPYEAILERYQTGKQIGYEQPETSDYFETIGSMDLYDLDVVTSREDDSLSHTFNSIPVTILEAQDDHGHFVRCNASFRHLLTRFFGIDTQDVLYKEFGNIYLNTVIEKLREPLDCVFFDDVLPDGYTMHAFARRIGINPVTGNLAAAVAVLSIMKPEEALPVERVISFVEQIGDHFPGGFFIYKADRGEELLYANQNVCSIFGCDSIEDFRTYSGFTFRGMVHPDDYEGVSASIDAQIQNGKYTQDPTEYRIIRKDGEIRWINDYGQYMKAGHDTGLFFVFISDNTDLHQQAESDKALHTAVIEALTKPYDSVWLINDLETEQFELYRIDQEMVHLMPAHMAVKLKKFSDAFAFYSKLVLEEDRQRFLDGVSPKSIKKYTENRPIYSVPFRRVFENEIRHYRVEFAALHLPDGKTGVVTGFRNVDQEENPDVDFNRFVNGFSAMTCVISVEAFDDGRCGKFRIVAGNDAYISSIENPAPGAEMLVNTFTPNTEYTNYLTRDLNFENYCYKSAVEKKCLHSYANPERMNGLWINMSFFPLAYEERIPDGKLCFCTYTMEFSYATDSKRLSTLSSDVAVSVLETCIKLRSAKDFKVSVKEVINDIGELCESEHCCILLMDHENRDCSVLCEAFSKDTKLLPMENYVDKAFYDIADSWKNVIAGSSCLIAKNEQDMEVVKERNPIWYESLSSAGAKNIILFPLAFGDELLGYIWAINFAAENATKIKETLETTTFILGSEIYTYQLMNRLKRLSSIDMLTGVMNRNKMNNYIDSLRENPDGAREPVGVIFADLNGLKCINDKYGHTTGDNVLKEAAGILKEIFDTGDIFRAGGDEFTVILRGITEEELNRKTEEIRKACEKKDTVSFALGSCLADDVSGILTALKCADEKMYEDKRKYYENRT